MHGIDLAPRICLVLFVPSGVTLMYYGPLGDDFFVNGWLLVVMWAGFLGWLTVAVLDYRGGNTRSGAGSRSPTSGSATRWSPSCSASPATRSSPASRSAWTRTRSGWAPSSRRTPCASCRGVLIRRELRPFGPAFGKLMTTGSTPEVEKAIVGSIRRCEPYVYAIWGLVFLAAVLGVVKPGSTAF